MIFHTIYSITIGEFAIMLKTKDINRAKIIPIWLPKKIVEKHYNKLLAEHNNNSNAKRIKELVAKDFDLLGVNLDVNRLEILEAMIHIYYVTWGGTKVMVFNALSAVYKDIYGKNPTVEDVLKVHKKKKLLIEKAHQVFGGNNEEAEEYDFDKDILTILKYYPNARNEKLYLLPLLMEDVLNKLIKK